MYGVGGGGGREGFSYFKLHWKNLANKYFNFGQFLKLSSVM